ncbi:MAG: hypothetical protein AB7N76_09940 [Planctomycetota bacterium]
MRSWSNPRLGVPLLLLAALTTPALAQPTSEDGRLFGMEFEFAGSGNRITNFDEMPFENYKKIMAEVVAVYGGDPNTIRRVDFTKPTSNLERWPSGERPLFRAEWTDGQGRTWMITPEYVASTGLDGYELVTPPLAKPSEVEAVLNRVRQSGLVREGLKSGVHLTVDARDLIKPNGDARALSNLMIMHENMEPMLRRMFNPVRGGGHANRFARSLAVDHEDILKEIDALPPEARTRERLEAIFNARNGKEATLQGADPMNPDSYTKLWKYRSMNLAKALNVNEHHDGSKGVVEFRMFDLHALENPDIHRMEAEVYTAMANKAREMAESGQVVRYKPRAAQPAGEDPSIYNTPQDPNQARVAAREMIESLGLDPARYEPLIEANVTKPRVLASEGEFKGMLENLPTGRVEHNGKAFTYGFELEGSGEGFARIARPKDAEVNARWDTMSDGEKLEYYRSTVGTNRSSVPQFFDLDLERYPFLDPNWKVEGTGNWEIRSKPVESIAEITGYMREVKKLTGQSGKGFHLHMRDNGVDWDMLQARGSELADFIERSSNWVWLERAKRLGTMTSIKSWSNARMTTSDVNKVAGLGSSGRATVRVTVPYDKSYIDLEIRGFTKYVDDIETLSKVYTDALKTGNFGPWKHTDNPLAYEGYDYSGVKRAPESLRFVDHVEEYLRDVEGKEMTPEMREVIDGLQHDYAAKSKGRARTYSTNVATALLPWDKEASLPESLRRELKFAREGFLRSLRYTANKVMDGEYGLDLGVASAEGLQKHLGLSEADAKALVEYRANGGKLDTAEDVARALARGADGAKLSRLSAVDLGKAELESSAVRERLGLSEAEAKALASYRDPVDVLEALQRSGVSDERALELIERSAGLDLISADATAEKIAKVTGLSPEAAARVIEYREAHELAGAEDLKKAGLSEADAARLWGLRGGPVELDAASDAELKAMGLSDAEIASLRAAGQAKTFRSYAELVAAAGLDADLARKLKNKRGITLKDLHELSAAEIAEKAGISLEDARKLVEARAARDVTSRSVLESVLGAERGAEVFNRAKGLDLASADAARLEALGLDAEAAKKVVAYRDAHRLGRAGSWEYEGYNAVKAGRELREAGVLSEAEAELIKTFTSEVKLESAKLEDLTGRFGMDAATAEKVLALRDAHRLDLEGLKAAGLSEADANRLLASAEDLDPRRTSLERMAERTGLSGEALAKVLQADGIDLTSASAEDIAKRLGISLEDAQKLVAARQAGNSLDSVEKLVEAGLSPEAASKAYRLAKGVDFGNATLEELREVGLTEAEAKRLLEVRDAAKAAPGLNYDEITRQVRFKTKEWAKEHELSEALLRSLLPRPNPEAYSVANEATTATSEGQGFARTRMGTGPFEPSKIGYETVSSVFAAVREGAGARLSEKIAEASAGGDAAGAKAAQDGIKALEGLKLEIVETNSILAEIEGGKVRVSTGLFNQVYARAEEVPPAERAAFRMRVLGLILGHETAHGAGIKAEAVADMESVKLLEKSRLGAIGKVTEAEIKTTLDVFAKPLGATHVDNFLNRLRELLKYGTLNARRENLERTARGEADPLAKYRRPDGTLKWKELTADRALREVGGVGHFALALFLKEVATVASTGDRARIEEFFDGLMTTDFYKQYGLFVAGARVGEVAYVKYLQRFIRPTFVSGLLKTNLVLAAGMALPLIVEGKFEGKAFAISLTSLGLSSAAVKAGVSGIKWVLDLGKAKEAGTLARYGLAGSRLAKIGGWFYTAAELAVVLYISEKIEHEINEYLDLQKAREELGKAGVAFVDALNDPHATPESTAAAAEAYHQAWIAYRDFLYGPLQVDEAQLAQRLEGAARKAKIKDDERKAALERLDKVPALKASIVRRYGSVEAYANTLVSEGEAAIEKDVNTYVDSYNLNRKKHLDEVYFSNRRTDPFMAGLESRDWLLRGGATGAEGDPWGSRSDTFANWGRSRARGSLQDALGNASTNRLQAYEDEASVYASLAAIARDAGKNDVARTLDERRELTLVLGQADEGLIRGNGIIDLSSRRGLTERVRKASGTGR